MKLKFLLFLTFFAGILNAQVVCEYPDGVITTLVITEARLTSTSEAYIEVNYMSISKFIKNSGSIQNC